MKIALMEDEYYAGRPPANVIVDLLLMELECELARCGTIAVNM
jgi:hypothetical protein